jgi:hypothetical protein
VIRESLYFGGAREGVGKVGVAEVLEASSVMYWRTMHAFSFFEVPVLASEDMGEPM